MMDVKIDSVEGKFKFRVCGIVRVNNKYLTVKIQNNDFYCLPGGHVELGEDTKFAVNREITEEIGNPIKNEKLFAIIENFFGGTEGGMYHEIGFYYRANLENEWKQKIIL